MEDLSMSTSSRGAGDTPTPAEELAGSGSSSLAKACDPCRRLKRKCDGGCPCSTCARAGRTETDCTYFVARGNKRHRTEPAKASSPKATSSNNGLVETVPRSGPLPALFTTLPSDSGALEKLWQGPSSSLSFFDLVQASIAGPETFFPEMSTARIAVPRPAPNLPEASVWTFDPSEALEKVLLEVNYYYLPIYTPDSFKSQIEEARASLQAGIRPPASQLAFLNGIMAMARRTQQGLSTDGIVEPDAEAELYNNRSIVLRNLELTGHGRPSLKIIQTMALNAIYESASRSVVETGELPILSQAGQLAVSMGLHEEPRPGEFDPSTAETRRRTFWALRSHATYVGGLSGARHLICTVQPTVSLPSAWPNLPLDTSTQNLIGLSNLALVISDIVKQLYESHEEKTPSAELRVVLDLEERLQEWKDKLPPEFSLDADRTAMPHYVQIMCLRWCYGRLMLMRPSLNRLLKSQPLLTPAPNERLSSIAWQGAERLCLEAAAELIDAESQCWRNPLWRISGIYNTDYIFLAMTVFLAARWHQPFPTFRVIWNKAIDLIRNRLPVVAERLDLLADHLEQKATVPDLSDGTEQQPDILGALLQSIWQGDIETGALNEGGRAQTW